MKTYTLEIYTRGDWLTLFAIIAPNHDAAYVCAPLNIKAKFGNVDASQRRIMEH